MFVLSGYKIKYDVLLMWKIKGKYYKWEIYIPVGILYCIQWKKNLFHRTFKLLMSELYQIMLVYVHSKIRHIIYIRLTRHSYPMTRLWSSDSSQSYYSCDNQWKIIWKELKWSLLYIEAIWQPCYWSLQLHTAILVSLSIVWTFICVWVVRLQVASLKETHRPILYPTSTV